MATRTIDYTFPRQCDMPSCMIANAPTAIFYTAATGTDGKTYISGTVASIVQQTDGSATVTISYDDTGLPAAFTPVYGATPNVYPPDCIGPGSWLWKLARIMGAGANPFAVDRTYRLFESTDLVAAGVFDLPRIPFAQGLRVTAFVITCDQYNADSQITINVTVNSAIIASYTGRLTSAKLMTLVVPDLPFDADPAINITAYSTPIYADGAKGLVVDMIGTIGA